MADTGLRYATQAISLPTQTISRGEVRASSDSAVTTTPASFWATIDTADVDIAKGKLAWVRIRG